MENIEKDKIDLQKELERSRNEMSLLYEVSNAMHLSLKLDEILYIILTAVTAHAGLGFNRAILFLINEKEGLLEGKMAIGPDTGEEANRIWTFIETEKMSLEDLINNYKTSRQFANSQLNRTVMNLRLPLKEEGSILTIPLLEGMPLHVKPQSLGGHKDTLVNVLKSEEFVTVPLRAKDKTIGVLYADNPYTREPITNDDIRILMMFANQAGLAIENSQLYEQTLFRSHTDSLTDLWNHGYFQFLLNEGIMSASKNNHPLSIIVADLDNFKSYNDVLGHQQGDKLLVQIAQILKNSARTQDKVCRYGGEEFSVLLPNTNKSDGLIVAETMRQAVEKHPSLADNSLPDKRLTISIGVSAFPLDAQTKEGLLNYADKALYSAKRQGRNRICG